MSQTCHPEAVGPRFSPDKMLVARDKTMEAVQRIASLIRPGMTEQQAQERGVAYKVGRFPFTASGKATAAGDRDGFVKLLFGEDDTLLGAHMVGQNVTEMIAEPTLARMLGATAHRIARTIHAHPTMNEGVMEAAEAALGEAIHL